MAKKRKNFMEGMGMEPVKSDSVSPEEEYESVDDIMSALEKNPIIGSLMQTMSEDNRKEFMLMFELSMRGVTPEQYSSFYHLVEMAGNISGNMQGMGMRSGRRGMASVKEYEPMKDAANHTILLKIQMKGVVKPPMWREVEVPADADFLFLHDVIQTVMGLDDCHLWQFNTSAYDHSLLIGESCDDGLGRGLEYVTDEARKTPITKFLHGKGDKLEYIYDFGDDWIFKLEVKDVFDRKSDYAVCTKYKGDLNPIEDFGGVWGYLTVRDDMEEWKSLSKKKRKERADAQGFDSPEEYYEFIRDRFICLAEVNESLAQMKKG